jgi:hypothetical protein
VLVLAELATLAVETRAAEVTALGVGAFVVLTALAATAALLPVVDTGAVADPPQLASARSGPVKTALPKNCRSKLRRDVTMVEQGEAIGVIPSGTA